MEAKGLQEESWWMVSCTHALNCLRGSGLCYGICAGGWCLMNLRWTLAKVFLQLYEDFESNFDLTRLGEQKASLLEEVEVMLRSHENHQQLVRSSQVQYYFELRQLVEIQHTS